MSDLLSTTEPVFVCGNPEMFGEGAATYKMPTNRPTWCMQATIPGFTDAQLRQDFADAMGLWSEVADTIWTETNDAARANVVIIDWAFDGPGGILMDATLPTPGIVQQRLRIDRGDRWSRGMNAPAGRIPIIPPFCHEGGHLLGSSHWPVGDPRELMEPSFDPLITKPQETESAWMAKLYGKPTPAQPKPPSAIPVGAVSCTLIAMPTSGRFDCKITAEMGDMIADLSGGEAWRKK